MVAARGRSDRIALIHAVYGLAWTMFAFGLGLPPIVAIVLAAVGITMLAIAVRGLNRTDGAQSPDAMTTGRAILRINVATAVAVVVALVILHDRASEAHVIGVVLTIMAVHFLPLWRLLRRRSLLVMAGALLVAALLTVSPLPAYVAAAVAAVVFLVNSGRLLRTVVVSDRSVGG